MNGDKSINMGIGDIDVKVAVRAQDSLSPNSVYVRIHQDRQDCYLEEHELVKILELCQKVKEL